METPRSRPATVTLKRRARRRGPGSRSRPSRASSTAARSGVPIREATRSVSSPSPPSSATSRTCSPAGCAAAAARCWASSPATSPTRSTSRSCGHQRGRPACATTGCSSATSTTARTWRSPTARCSSDPHADGIIVIGDIDGGDDTLDRPRAQHRYVVGVTDRTARRQIPGVYADNVAGTVLALEHLWGPRSSRDHHCVSGHPHVRRSPADRPLRAVHARARGADQIGVFITDQETEPRVRARSPRLRRFARPEADCHLRHVGHHRVRPDAGCVPGRDRDPATSRSSASTTSTWPPSRSRR